MTRIPTFSGKSNEFHDWASWVNGYIAGYKEYFGRDEFRELVISRVPQSYRAYLASLREPVLDYFDVFEILHAVVCPDEPSMEMDLISQLTPINLLDRQSVDLFMQHHLIHCLVNGRSEDDAKFHLLDHLFYPVGEVIDVAFYEFNYKEAVAMAKHLTHLFAAKAQRYLKSDPSVNLTKVYEETADDIFGKLCDVWAAERGYNVEDMKFKIGPGESVFDDEKLYETMFHYGTEKASAKTTILMRRAIKQQRMEQSDYGINAPDTHVIEKIRQQKKQKKISGHKIELMDLPAEILEMIAEYLRVDWLMNLQECNKRLHSIVGQNVWRQLSISDTTEDLFFSGFTPTCCDETIVHPHCCQRRCIRLDHDTTKEFYRELVTSGVSGKMEMQLQSVEKLTVRMMNVFRAIGQQYWAYLAGGLVQEEEAPDNMAMVRGFKTLLPRFCPNVKELNISEVLDPCTEDIIDFDCALVAAYPNAVVNVDYKIGRTESSPGCLKKLFRNVFEFPNLRHVCLFLQADQYENFIFNMQLPEGVTILTLLCENDVRISEAKLKWFLSKTPLWNL